MTDLLKIDPATAMPSAELDTLIAKWMGWGRCEMIDGLLRRVVNAWDCGGKRKFAVHHWSPTTNAAHAGEARRRAGRSKLDHSATFNVTGSCRCYISVGSACVGQSVGYHEVAGTDDEIHERAEALATCRAILAAIQARHKQAEMGDAS